MALPIEHVCPYCLESVQVLQAGEPRTPATCSTCGSPIEYGRSPTRVDGTVEISAYRASLGSVEPQTPAQDEREWNGRIGRYLLHERIGGGGYGNVYRAFDSRLEREVALKVLKPAKLDTKATERFLREARAAAKLSHRNIVVVHDAGEDDGRPWIAYQLIDGLPLSKLRAAHTLDLRAAVAIVRDLSDALRHAHDRGICHRDIKPANVIVDRHGVPYLTDFGLARRVDLDSDLTGEGTVLGTPGYMSPEQAMGLGNAVDGRSDIYSLGVIFYELLCGCRPSDWPADTPVRKNERTTSPPTPRLLVRTIPPTLDRICMKALALNPKDRYQDVGAFADALEGWLDREPSPQPAQRVPTSLLGSIVAAAAVVMLMLVLGVSGNGMNQGEGGPQAVAVAQAMLEKSVVPTHSPGLNPVSTPVAEATECGILRASKNRETLHWDHDSPARGIEPKKGGSFFSLEAARRQESRLPCPVCLGGLPCLSAGT
jgi:serine/threonine protein kinase